MGTVAIILKRPPYGDLNAAEAVRHALGAASFEMNVDLILVGGGVLLARKGQTDAGTGFTNLEDVLNDCMDMGVAVYADSASLEAQRLVPHELMENVKPISKKEIAGLMKNARSTMIF